MCTRISAALAALCLAAPAEAAIYSGNPHIEVEIDGEELTGGLAELDALVLHRCDGGRENVPVAETIDPTVGWGDDISAGCYVGVSVMWSSIVTLSGAGFSLEHDRVSTHVELIGAVQEAPLEPYMVTSGSYSGALWLTVTLQ